MKRTLQGMIVVGEPLMRQALEAMRAYQDAESAGYPAEEAECLKKLAESLFQAVADYQLRALGGTVGTLH
ncbi:hypothetical protein TZ03_01920 [Pseudomonas sp. 10-1B]|nr:hypothetical protein [Pseudomonas sp. 10-1B]KIY42457.1 hypothetical protein TZ03_01920 [Pseudomonas sp. 10-1B]